MRYFQAHLILKTPLSTAAIVRQGSLYKEFDRKFFVQAFGYQNGAAPVRRGKVWMEKHLSSHEKIADTPDDLWYDEDENTGSDPLINNDIGVIIVALAQQVCDEDLQNVIERSCLIWDNAQLLTYDLWECSYNDCVRLERQAYVTRCWVFDSDDVEIELDLGDLGYLYRRGVPSNKVIEDFVVDTDLGQNEVFEKSAELSCSVELKNEIAQLYKNTGQTSFLPIHYLIEGNSVLEERTIANALVSALYATERLATNHVFLFDIDEAAYREGSNDNSLRRHITPALGRALQGNVILIRYGLNDQEDNYNPRAYSILGQLIEVLKPHLDTTQLIFAVPPHKHGLAKRLTRVLNMPLRCITEDETPSARSIDRGAALQLLEQRAASDGLDDASALTCAFDKRLEDKSFSDIDGFYTTWKHQELIRQRFPEYQSEADYLQELLERPSAQSALEELDELIGLEPVKQQIRDVIARAAMTKKAKAAGLPTQDVTLHCAFLGNPGTGKTEVARLYGQILKEAGILREGRVISVSGGSGFQVDEAFHAAAGSVLFVDEAYGMVNLPSSCIAQFIAEMENRRGDVVVILAGYEEEMNDLFARNPGFSSRIGFTLAFPDYTAEEKLDIFKLMCRRSGLTLSDETVSAANSIIVRAGSRRDQGNARYVRKLFEDSLGKQQVRLAQAYPDNEIPTLEELKTLLPEDVEAAGGKKTEQIGARQELTELIGLDNVKSLVDGYLNLMRMQKVRRDAGITAEFQPMHMAFMGNPGTGKTEVARLIGRILREEGVLAIGDFYECGREDLISPVAGGTARMVRALFEEARGSVIFIDEAYSLLYGNGKTGVGDEAIATIIDQMEKLRDEVVVIFAGYTEEIEELLQCNPGFSSRVNTRITFSDYSSSELLEIFELMTHKAGFSLGEGTAEKVEQLIERASAIENFGNARFVRNVLEQAIRTQSSRALKLVPEDASKLDTDAIQTLLPEDIDDTQLDNLMEGCSVGDYHIGFSA